MITVIVCIIAILIAIALLAIYVLAKRKKRAEYISSLDKLMPQLDTVLSAQDKSLDFSSGYLMKKDWDSLISSGTPLLEAITSIPEKIRRTHPRYEDMCRFASNCTDPKIRPTRNEEYKKAELKTCDAMLSDIDGKSLDPQQRDAVITDEYNNLVIAGAGSGKTLTVVGKIKYLVERWSVRPEDILVTSFTRKSVDELAERIEKAGIDGVSCRTFHKIGLDRLGKVGVADDNMLKRCVKQYLREDIHRHPDQMRAYIEFYGCYMHVPKDYSEYGQDGERLEALKVTELTTLKGQLDTLNGERVKSVEELMIANFLFLHGVNYEYERVYPGEYESPGRAYQPDFYLTDYDIYLEHFGVNERGRCPWIATPIEEKKYLEGMRWKREVHAKNGTKLIESYSYWNKDHDLLNKLRALLESNGVTLVEDEEMMARIYKQLGRDDKYLKSISKLVTTFLSLAKANNITMAEIADRGRESYEGDGYMWHRFELFIAFAGPIMVRYQQTLREEDKVDFDDMINMASEKIASEGLTESYRYIIVDEYQDISKSRFGLIKAIREACGAKLMCVGDDWQSIYRFAGSDVSLFTDFEEYVGFHETMKIEQTYRNSQELVDITSEFIERNPAQVHKKMISAKHEEMPLVISYGADMASGLERCLSNILQTRKERGKILVLGRHNFDIETAYPDFRGKDVYRGKDIELRRDHGTDDVDITFKGREDITFMSVHRAKGLEADDVIVLNLINDMYGFPNHVEDDPILNILLNGDDDYEFSEERRLFYVAMTRTKGTAYLVSGALDSGNGPSPFVNEIRSSKSTHIGIFKSKEIDALDPVLCPRCGTGRLVIRKNSKTGKSFLGCTNYPYCERSYDQIEILEDKLKCPRCGGWMVRRHRGRDDKPFFGCSNFPDCSATIDADDCYVPIFPLQRQWDHGDSYSYEAVRLGHSSSYNSRSSNLKCPKCGAPLRELKNKKDGSFFYGCTRYPKCKYTRSK